jgi:hypothetical protein
MPGDLDRGESAVREVMQAIRGTPAQQVTQAIPGLTGHAATAALPVPVALVEEALEKVTAQLTVPVILTKPLPTAASELRVLQAVMAVRVVTQKAKT